MALDFPTAPSVGQKYPASPIAGIPTYTWDGEKWTTSGPSLTPIYVAKAGDTMSGHLVLPTGPAVDNAVRKDYVDAAVSGAGAPFDSLAYNGMQFNGSMEVNQEYGGTGTTLANAQKYIADGFMCAIVGGAFTIYGSNPIGTLPGFQNAIYLNVTTANALTAGDYQCILHPIEGYRWARLFWGAANAQPVTISFWVWSTAAGTMAVGVRNALTNRNYRVDVPVTAASWQYKTVTIPGDVTGTWDKTNTVGATIIFGFGAGSSLKGPANTWATSNLMGTTATTNFCGTVGNQIYLTGVTALPGSQAPTAAQSPYIMRPFDQELATCQRYWQKILTFADFPNAPNAGSSLPGVIPFLQPMRTVPTVTFAQLFSSNCSAPTSNQMRYDGGYSQVVSSAAGRSYWYGDATMNARL